MIVVASQATAISGQTKNMLISYDKKAMGFF